MRLDVFTIAGVGAVLYVLQIFAVFVQHRVNKAYAGSGLWLTGAVLQGLGFTIMMAYFFPRWRVLSALANPIIFAGMLFLNASVRTFLGFPVRKRLLTAAFLVFLSLYYYFLFASESISMRSFIVYFLTSIVAAMTSSDLIRGRNSGFSSSALFTAAIFACFGSLLFTASIINIIMPKLESYENFYDLPYRAAVFIFPLVSSVMWTFGYIIMMNQRLNSEIDKERENLQLLFSMSPDVKILSRLSDGVFIDVNDGFIRKTGYTREEIIGSSKASELLWFSDDDRKSFFRELRESGHLENREYPFRVKGGECLIGLISSRNIYIKDEEHIISVVIDITERKAAEKKIEQLVQQLEAEKREAQLNAITDKLTGLSNRRHLDDALRTEFNRMKRSGEPLSVIILDIDHFKEYNDSYGHPAGDECIRSVSGVLKNAVTRLYDVAARYGGEEFMLVLPETGREGAGRIAEKIRSDVEELCINHEKSALFGRITVSIGAVTLYNADGLTPAGVVELADRALYDAKQNGRNRVDFICFGE